jgi:hypothetical protein
MSVPASGTATAPDGPAAVIAATLTDLRRCTGAPAYGLSGPWLRPRLERQYSTPIGRLPWQTG